MSSSVRKILDEIYKLSREDRAFIRAALAEHDESISPEDVETAWHDELARRVGTVNDGSGVLHEHDDVLRELDEIAAS